MDAVCRKWSLKVSETGIRKAKSVLRSSSSMYWDIIGLIFKEPSCIKSWQQIYAINFNKDQWKKIFTLPRSLTLDSKLIEMQLKIIHRIYATDSYVSNFAKDVSKLCQYCNIQNNIFHWFSECQKLETFWKHFDNWINSELGLSIKPDVKCIVFGYVEKECFELNFSLLHAKMYIHKTWLQYQKTSNHYFSFISFLIKLKYAVCIEREIDSKRKDIESFSKKFHLFEEIL